MPRDKGEEGAKSLSRAEGCEKGGAGQKEGRGDEKCNGRDGNKKPGLLKSAIGIVRDIVIAAVIVLIVMGILYAYSGVWPPPVVIESQSMSHGQDWLPPSQIGVIDGGDMVIVKKASAESEIATYVQGEKSGYSTYGEYGDVIIYRPPAQVRYDQTPVIHRAVLRVQVNPSTGDTWDVPELGKTNTLETLTLDGYGYNGVDIKISLSSLMNRFKATGRTPHGGFITMGDHNAALYRHGGHETDQEAGICPEPVEFDWIVGVARGELPWFGGLKLWVSGNTLGVPENTWWCLGFAIAMIIVVPMALDYAIDRIRKKRKGSGRDDGKKAGGESPGDAAPGKGDSAGDGDGPAEDGGDAEGKDGPGGGDNGSDEKTGPSGQENGSAA